MREKKIYETTTTTISDASVSSVAFVAINSTPIQIQNIYLYCMRSTQSFYSTKKQSRFDKENEREKIKRTHAPSQRNGNSLNLSHSKLHMRYKISKRWRCAPICTTSTQADKFHKIVNEA